MNGVSTHTLTQLSGCRTSFATMKCSAFYRNRYSSNQVGNAEKRHQTSSMCPSEPIVGLAGLLPSAGHRQPGHQAGGAVPAYQGSSTTYAASAPLFFREKAEVRLQESYGQIVLLRSSRTSHESMCQFQEGPDRPSPLT